MAPRTPAATGIPAPVRPAPAPSTPPAPPATPSPTPAGRPGRGRLIGIAAAVAAVLVAVVVFAVTRAGSSGSPEAGPAAASTPAATSSPPTTSPGGVAPPVVATATVTYRPVEGPQFSPRRLSTAPSSRWSRRRLGRHWQCHPQGPLVARLGRREPRPAGPGPRPRADDDQRGEPGQAVPGRRGDPPVRLLRGQRRRQQPQPRRRLALRRAQRWGRRGRRHRGFRADVRRRRGSERARGQGGGGDIVERVHRRGRRAVVGHPAPRSRWADHDVCRCPVRREPHRQRRGPRGRQPDRDPLAGQQQRYVADHTASDGGYRRYWGLLTLGS